MNIKPLQPDVFVGDDKIVTITPALIARIKTAARISPRGRARILAHPDIRHPVQEMLIAICRDSYLRPHRHTGKSESFHVIEGTADVVLFDDNGGIQRTIRLGIYPGDSAFYYRISDALFHTLIIHSDTLVIHETTCGPFTPGDCVFAEWAPAPDDSSAVFNYQAQLRTNIFKATGKNDRPHLTT